MILFYCVNSLKGFDGQAAIVVIELNLFPIPHYQYLFEFLITKHRYSLYLEQITARNTPNPPAKLIGIFKHRAKNDRYHFLFGFMHLSGIVGNRQRKRTPKWLLILNHFGIY